MSNNKLSRLSTRSHAVDMTQGSITSHIIRFAFPLLIGNLFQQLYNTVDTWVVGNYVSNEAFSAVGSVGPITNMLIGFFMGLSSGAGVVISQHYGAKQYDKVEKAVHTAVAMTILLGVVFTFLGLSIIPVMLNLIQMHESSAKEATIYLTIIFSGIIGQILYNMGAGILRAIGDSRRPFYYLVVCAVLNTILDLVFVLIFRMGIEGVAFATIISQCVSATLVIITLLRTDTCIKLSLIKIRIDRKILKKIIYVGIPAALQMAITSFSNVFVQSYIYQFDAGSLHPDYTSGWTAYSKIDQVLFLPMQSISLASTTFVAQNLGCNQIKRAKQGVKHALLIALCSTVILLIPVMIFAPNIVSFLNNRQEVIERGTMFLRLLSPFYILCCVNQVYASALRGAGNSRASMIILLSGFVLFRQVYLFVMSRICNEIIPIAMSYPAGWLLCSILTSVYFHKVNLSHTRLTENSEYNKMQA